MRQDMLAVSVEFYGIPRTRSGVAMAMFELSVEDPTLGALLQAVHERFSELAEQAAQNELSSSLAVNVNGKRFVRDPQTVLADGDVVLLMSADAGG